MLPGSIDGPDVRRPHGKLEPACETAVRRVRRDMGEESDTEPVRLIYLGGLAEVGKNMLLLEYAGASIIIDCGVAFPEADQEQLGIDLIVPDISYMATLPAPPLGIFITHGHEDHIGALPHLLPTLGPLPIHATPLTLALIEAKLTEARLVAPPTLIPFDPDTQPELTAGPFVVEPFRVCHSIPDAVGFGVRTPAGRVVVSGDFKFDPTPIDGRLTDLTRLRTFGESGVRLLLSDCVHIEQPGRTPSEQLVGETLERVIAAAPGRVLIATFASLIARLQQVIDIAARQQRAVAVVGRSLVNNVRIARERGYLRDPHQLLIDAKTAADLPDSHVIYIVTGAQGEPMAALSRIASGHHRDITVGSGDTVVLSASPIPGNETAVFRVIDQLFAAGAEVIYGTRDRVHVSGHAARDELREMIELTSPRHVIPVHGEPRHMALYRELALGCGLLPAEITFATNGDVIEITPDSVAIRGRVPAGPMLIDGPTIGAIGDVILRDRRALARDGMLTVVVTISRHSGEILAGPAFITRGYLEVSSSGELLAAAKAHVGDALAAVISEYSDAETGYLNQRLREITTSFFQQELRRRPVVLPLVQLV